MWSNGDSYYGSFKNNNLHGQGIFKWADGKSYEGTWAFNNMDGVSKFFLKIRKEFSIGEMDVNTKEIIKQGLKMATGLLNLVMAASI